jgi:hypothetical protein
MKTNFRAVAIFEIVDTHFPLTVYKYENLQRISVSSQSNSLHIRTSHRRKFSLGLHVVILQKNKAIPLIGRGGT